MTRIPLPRKENTTTTTVFNGHRFRAYRHVRSMSPRTLATTAGITSAEVSAYERGHATPTPAILTRLATTLDCAREDLCSTQDTATDPHEYIRAACAALPRLEDRYLTRIATVLRAIDLERT